MVEEFLLRENQQHIIKILETHQNELLQLSSDPIESLSYAYISEGLYLGGITGKMTGNRLHISLLGVRKESRNLSIGTELLKTMEEAAIKRNCLYLTVNTQDFQGLGFYKTYGFEVFGELIDCPFEGTTKYFLRKILRK